MEAILLVVGVFVALIASFVIWMLRQANAKYAELWGRLTGMVNGTSKGARMSGTYLGAPVEAEIKSVSGDDETTYYYELSLTSGERGQEEWSVNYGGEKLFGFGEQRWHVKAKDGALKDRLVAGRVLELAAAWPQHRKVSYRAKRGALVYYELLDSGFAVPTPEEFKAQLELLARLAEINRQVNI